ncbi:AraC family transcriptional regulator [Amycolatopsis pithecellobii]|uniref:Helix-turn-helix domain-containing protein n=1 Tax=Amycolatopsis pithecellobii TaxID=664692 RepID=A0A6N7Z6G3_9PSEU|nr:AraC family transcriptional regulator [Amycolatopsis pithecellobii]MTD56521.1 helix-turn-helix domain-containing protein [Amycolatopsis pithecellobii]
MVDVIGEAMGTLRVGNPYARKVKESGSWGLRYAAFAGSGFHIVSRGRGWLITPSGSPRALKPGDVVLVLSGAEHGLSHAPSALGDLPWAKFSAEPAAPGPADFEALCGAYRLDRGQVHHYFTALPEIIAVSPDYEHDPQLRVLAELLHADTADSRPGTSVTRPALLDLLVVHVLRRWLEQNGTPEWPQVSDPAVVTALRCIHGDPRKAWTVQQLSETAGLSRTVFTRRFISVLGTSPRAYLTTVRLTRGARLLRETAAPLATIARQVGYSTEYAFGGAFRRVYGVSPGRFRKAGQQQD